MTQIYYTLLVIELCYDVIRILTIACIYNITGYCLRQWVNLMRCSLNAPRSLKIVNIQNNQTSYS